MAAYSAAPSPVTSDQFTFELLRSIVTTDRVAKVMARIAGDRIEVGPLRFGPGGAVAATGAGVIGAIQVTPSFRAGSGAAPGSGPGSSAAGLLAFDATVPGDVTIDLTFGSGGNTHRYEGSVVVQMHIDVVLQAPTSVVLEVAPLEPPDVTVRLQTEGLATFVLQTLGDADGEVAAQVAAVVNERVEAVAELRRIDLAVLLDRAWDLEFETRLGAGGR